MYLSLKPQIFLYGFIIACIYSDKFIKHMLQRIAFRGKTNAIILFSPLPCECFPAEFALSNVITIVSAAIKRNDIWWYSVFLQTCDKFIFVHMLVVSSAEQQGVITYVLRDQHGAVVVVGGRCAIDGLLRTDSIYK